MLSVVARLRINLIGGLLGVAGAVEAAERLCGNTEETISLRALAFEGRGVLLFSVPGKHLLASIPV